MSRDDRTGHIWPTRKRKQIARRRAVQPLYMNPNAGVRDSRTLAAELIELMATRTTETTTQAKARPNQKEK